MHFLVSLRNHDDAQYIINAAYCAIAGRSVSKHNYSLFTQHTLARIKEKYMPDVSTTFFVVLLSGKYKKEECSSYLYHREKGIHKYSGNQRKQ